MRLTNLSYEEAKFAHQQYYDDNFEVITIKRSGYFNFFPFSLIHGLSDIGEWEGLFSTNGKKIIISKSANLDTSKIVKIYSFPLTYITDVNIDKTFGKYITLEKPEKGFTRSKLNGLAKLILFLSIYGIPFLFVYEKYMGKNKHFVFGVEEDYGVLDKFKKLIAK